MKPVRASTTLAELAAMTALLLSYIWLWQGAFRGHFLVCCALYAGLGLASQLRRGESAREAGFRLDNLGRGVRQTLPWIGSAVLAVVLAGVWLDSLRAHSTSAWPSDLAQRFVWGTAQQYGLLAFYFRRLGEVLSGTRAPAVTAALVFAMFHLPNPFLVVATVLAGGLSCWLYRRVANLWALGLAHALLSLALSHGLPPELTGGMRVGPGYWRFLERLQAWAEAGRGALG